MEEEAEGGEAEDEDEGEGDEEHANATRGKAHFSIDEVFGTLHTAAACHLFRVDWKEEGLADLVYA